MKQEKKRPARGPLIPRDSKLGKLIARLRRLAAQRAERRRQARGAEKPPETSGKKRAPRAPLIPPESKLGKFIARMRRFRRTPMGDLTIALVWVLAGVIVGIGLFSGFSDVLGIMKDQKQVEVQVKAGWTTFDMASAMRKAGVIRHPFLFTLYTMLNDSDGTFKSGTYLLDGGMSYDKIINIVQRRKSAQSVRITFTEGMNAKSIAASLEENGVCAAGEFLAAVNSSDFSNYYFVPKGDPESGRFYLLEGYLFPDTYDFYKNEDVNSVIKKFLSNFNAKFTENMYNQAVSLGMSIDQVVTLASIIEKEAPDTYEMAKVSSVFHNRLNNPAKYPRLQSDVTSFYVRNVIYKTVSTTNPLYTRAYDTYVRTGLPAGPICNPGGAALTAALNPSRTPYYYFVTDSESHFYYARNLAEHNANIRKASGKLGGTYTHD